MDKGGKVRYYEGCGKEGPILCIFLCEFHSTYGPKILCQVPKDFISKETFESVNVYLIPKPQLIRSIITVTLDNIKIVGYPVRIENEKYPRNAFYYNLCFVCDSWARTNQYDQVVKDLSAFLRQLEEDENFLFKMDEGGDSTRVTKILDRVLADLNTNKFCSLQEGKRNVRLKVGHHRDIDIPLHKVPVLTRPLNMKACQHWDSNTIQTLTKVVQYVDNVNHVEKMANLTNVDVNKIKTVLRYLINDGAIKMIAQYDENNLYMVTPDIRRLFIDKQLQSDCLSNVSLPGGGSASMKDVIRIYSSLNRGATMKDICQRFDMVQMKIDERKLIQFGHLHGLIRKLNKYISYVNEDGKDREDIYTDLNGKKCYEEVCTESSFSANQLDHLIDTDFSFVTIYK